MVAIAKEIQFAEPKPNRKISWEDFQRRYLDREDEYKYEWVDGEVEKTLRTMDKKQHYFFDNLSEFLEDLKFAQKRRISGRFITEADNFFSGNHRRPDIAFFTKEQILEAKEDKDVVPQFVIEVISTHDKINKVERKMDEYRTAGVQVIWQIYPEFKMVKELRGYSTKTLIGDDICSAEPVIEGFRISVNDIFK